MARICCAKHATADVEIPCLEDALARKWNIICSKSPALLAKPSFRTDAKAIANQAASGSASSGPRTGARCGLIEIGKIVRYRTDPRIRQSSAKRLIPTGMILERELIEQRRLRLLQCSHHQPSSTPFAELNQERRPSIKARFSTQ